MPNPIGPDAVYRLVYVYDPHVSPDGRQLTFAHAWVDEDATAWRSHVMLVPLAGGQPYPIRPSAASRQGSRMSN